MTADDTMALDPGHTPKGTLAGKQLIPRELAELTLDAGWQNYDSVVTQIMVWYAESLGFTEAVGGPNKDGSYDYGFAQLNSGHAKAWGFTDDAFKEMAFTPEEAIVYARQLYVAADFHPTPWYAYTNGSYENPVFRLRAIQGIANHSAEVAGYTPVPKFATRG